MKWKSQIISSLIPLLLFVLGAPQFLIASKQAPGPVNPSFSHAPGFYEAPFSLSLLTPESDSPIHITLDGSQPDRSSPIYQAPILIEKTTVVKAVCLTSQGESRNAMVGTFLIQENIASGLPVVSLSTDSLSLFDTISGLYTRGTMTRWGDPSFLQNYWKRDELPIHFEFFDEKGDRVVEQAAGAKLFGNTSRELPQKSFRLTARKEYGQNRFKHQFFPHKDLFSFKELLIRNAGTDWNYAHVRDAFIQNWVEGRTFLDTQASRPCVVFINGKYWGVYHLREYISKHMIASHYGLNSDSINILENSISPKEGNNDDFVSLCQFILNHDLALAANYDSVQAQIDLKNLTDYWAVETWAANWDWMHHNVRFWSDPSSNTPWRYILWDLDRSLGTNEFQGRSHLWFNIRKTWTPHVTILKALLRNEDFKVYFINRYADLLNSLFSPAPLLAGLKAMVDLMSPEMPRHFDTWGIGKLNPRWGKKDRGTYDQWLHGEVNYLRSFLVGRQETARNEFQEELGLQAQHPLYLQAYPPEAGKILVNTVDVTDFPWQGTYFEGIPVTLTALPNPGYTFDFWQEDRTGSVLNQAQSIQIDLADRDSLSAHFSGAPVTPLLTVSEIKTQSNRPIDSGDWIELHNPGQVPFDLSHWTLKDDQDHHRFVFPEGTLLAPGSFLVVAQDKEAFSSVYPSLHPFGPLPFGFSNTHDEVRLFNPSFEEYLRVGYRNASPWPHLKPKENASLELIDPMMDPSSPSNWRKSRRGVSPGKPRLRR